MRYSHLMYFKCLKVMNWHLAQMETKEERRRGGMGKEGNNPDAHVVL